MNDEKKLDLIGCGVYMGSRWSKQNTIAELEKIKEEISKLTIYYTTVGGHINLISDNAVYRIIDKEISELQGEQNEQ